MEKIINERAIDQESQLMIESRQRFSRTLKSLPDYTQLDTRGFLPDVWDSFKLDMVTILAPSRAKAYEAKLGVRQKERYRKMHEQDLCLRL